MTRAEMAARILAQCRDIGADSALLDLLPQGSGKDGKQWGTTKPKTGSDSSPNQRA